MSNLTHRSKCTFLGIFTSAHSESAFVVQSVNLSCVKFIFITFFCKYTLSTMIPRKKNV